MKGMLFENLDHYFTNLFLQIYEIVHIYISLLKSIKSVDTKMSTEEYSESYATMYKIFIKLCILFRLLIIVSR